MDKFVIKGNNKLKGEVSIGGAKNSVLKLMAAAILGNGPSVLHGVPKISDVGTMIEVLQRLGIETEWIADSSLRIDPSGKISCEASYDLIRQMRASIIVLGPLLAKLGEARVAMPGGCNIGSRKIDIHLRGLELLGAQIEMGHGYIEAKRDALRGTVVPLEFPSVGATENLMMAAVMAEGTTIIENAAREPEIVDLADFLKAMGAIIKGAGTVSIEIKGIEELRGAEYTVIPDRIEAGTLLLAGAVTGGDVTVKCALRDHLTFVLRKLAEAGAQIEESRESIRLTCGSRPKAVDVATLPYPGFPTDLQPQMMTFLSLAEGTSIITENVFENRFLFVEQINKMGTDIRIQGQHAIVQGVESLKGAALKCPDLRAGAGLVLAGLAARGISELREIYHIDRGYENLEQKLQELGADIQRVSEEVSDPVERVPAEM